MDGITPFQAIWRSWRIARGLRNHALDFKGVPRLQREADMCMASVALGGMGVIADKSAVLKQDFPEVISDLGFEG